jgi:CheY-like chemotaxis protein
MVGNKFFLLVDDDDDDKELFEEVLLETDPSASLQTAANGLEALALLNHSTARLPQLIFMDLNMPRMGGKECLRRLKGDDRLKHIPVVIYTTSTLPSHGREMMQEGALAYIAKPTSIQSLRVLLATALRTDPSALGQALSELDFSDVSR